MEFIDVSNICILSPVTISYDFDGPPDNLSLSVELTLIILPEFINPDVTLPLLSILKIFVFDSSVNDFTIPNKLNDDKLNVIDAFVVVLPTFNELSELLTLKNGFVVLPTFNSEFNFNVGIVLFPNCVFE